MILWLMKCCCLGGFIVPYNGTLNTATMRCDTDQALIDQQVWLQLEVCSNVILKIMFRLMSSKYNYLYKEIQ